MSAPSQYPAPAAIPIAATSQSEAAVVRPRTDRPCRMIAPAPRKPIPLTICAAIRVGSTLPSKLWNPYAETSVKSAEPTETTRCVRSPAWRSRSSRSRPIAPPSAAATKMRSSTSGQPIVWTAASRLGELTRDGLRLKLRDLADARRRQLEQFVERLTRERVALGSRLHPDEPSVAGHHNVHVGVRARVLGVVEVEQRDALHHADRDSGDRVAERAREAAPLEGAHRRDVRATDRRAPRAAVGLDDIAVQPQRPLAERLEVDHRPNRAPDQPLDLDRPSLLLPAGGLSLHALARRRRQKRVLGGDPALSLAPQPARSVLVDHRRAEHFRPPLRDDDGAVWVLEVVRLERDRAQLVGLPAVSSVHAAASSSVATVTCSTSRTGSWRKRRPSSRKAAGSPVVRNR